MSARSLPLLFIALSSMSSAPAATIFTTQLPGSGSANFTTNTSSIELGVRFRSDSAGQITGLRFYKAAGNTGPHTGHLWTNTGTLLGSLTFTGETATGWQSASFAAPIAIQAGTTYVASYHTASYSVTRFAFAAAGIDNPPLHALQNGVDGANGLYVYSSAAAFPNKNTRSSNYWVDVLFSAAGSTVPAILGLSPSSATAGGVAFALQVLGSGFLSSSTVLWNGAGRPTTFVSSAALSALISSADVVSAGTAAVTVLNPSPGGGVSSPSVFTIATAAVSATVDDTPPLISSVAVTSIGQSSAIVAWSTNEASTSQVEYGTSTAYGSATALDVSTAAAHSRLLSGLSAGTLYHYRVRSADAAGNLAVSGDDSFTTSVFIGTKPTTVVSLTFDDDMITQLLARDILNQKGVKGTFYIASGLIGLNATYMTVSQIQSIAAGGHEIGGHSINHLHLGTLASEQLQHQICDDRAALVSLGFNPVSFAYPYGEYNSAVKSMAANCGYMSGRASWGLGCPTCPAAGPIPPPDAFAIATEESLKNTTTLAAMQKMVADAEQAGGGWVPLVFHSLCDNCGIYAVSPSTFAVFIDWVKLRAASGTVIKTVAEVMGAGVAPPMAAITSPAAGAFQGIAAAAAAFEFRDLYAFPNPSRRGERVTIRLQVGVADAVDVSIFDLSGRRVNSGSAAGPVLLDDGNGKGPQFTYDYHWDVSGAASAVYFYAVTARKQGQAGIGRTGKVALIK